jgi:hypothetical protein
MYAMRVRNLCESLSSFSLRSWIILVQTAPIPRILTSLMEPMTSLVVETRFWVPSFHAIIAGPIFLESWDIAIVPPALSLVPVATEQTRVAPVGDDKPIMVIAGPTQPTPSCISSSHIAIPISTGLAQTSWRL